VWVPWRDFWSFKTTLWGRAITHYLAGEGGHAGGRIRCYLQPWTLPSHPTSQTRHQ